MRLSEGECRELLAAIDMHLEGVKDAWTATEEDPTIDSLDVYMGVLGDLREHEAVIKSAREKIFREFRQRNRASTFRSLLSDIQAHVRSGPSGPNQPR